MPRRPRRSRLGGSRGVPVLINKQIEQSSRACVRNTSVRFLFTNRAARAVNSALRSCCRTSSCMLSSLSAQPRLHPCGAEASWRNLSAAEAQIALWEAALDAQASHRCTDRSTPASSAARAHSSRPAHRARSSMRSNPLTPTFPCWAARGAPATSRRPTTTLPWTPKCPTRWGLASPGAARHTGLRPPTPARPRAGRGGGDG